MQYELHGSTPNKLIDVQIRSDEIAARTFSVRHSTTRYPFLFFFYKKKKIENKRDKIKAKPQAKSCYWYPV